MFPEGWVLKNLGELFDFQNGANADKSAYGSGIRFINVLEVVTHSHLHHEHIPGRVNLSKSAIASFAVMHGDLLFNRTSETQEEVGLSAVYIGSEAVVFGGFVIRGRPRSDALDPIFAGYAIRAPQIRSQIVKMGQGAVRANVGQSDLSRVFAAIPPLREQRAIAGALNDVDELIAELDHLIAKKREIKQATMQQLLTGTTRLPGFGGAWQKINMAKSSSLKARIGWQGLTTEEYLDSGEYYLVTGTDFQNGEVHWSSCCFVDGERYAQDRNIQLKKGDVLITKDGTIGKVGFVREIPGPATLNSGVFVIRPKSAVYDPQFLYYVLASSIFSKFLDKLQAGSTIVHLYQKDFVSFDFHAPDLDEQKSIVRILADMDAEIAALECKREKTRLLKQGMMQELLTGRTRLV